MADNLSVEWGDYQKNICKGLGALQQRGEFVDMTLAADGHHVKVHQMVMSLVSPFIKDLISSAQCPHPVIFLNRVSYLTMQAILEYAYTGQVVVRKDKIGEFLEACRDLHIRGLEHMMKEAQSSSSAHSVSMFTQVNPDMYEAHSNNANIQPDKIVSFTDDDTDYFARDDAAADDDDVVMSEQVSDAKKKKRKKNNIDDGKSDSSVSVDASQIKNASIQYSVSCQGNLQLVLNRYLYTLRHVRKDGTRFWRCSSQQVTRCPAFLTTREDAVRERANLHNHSFHDKQIIKRMRDSNMFTTIVDVEGAADQKRQKKKEGDLIKKGLDDTYLSKQEGN